MTLQTIGILLTAVTVSIAAIYYTMTLRYTKRSQELQLETRQAQLFMPIYSVYQSEDHIKAVSEIMKWEYDSYDDYMAKYGEEVNPEAYMMYRKIFGYRADRVLVQSGETHSRKTTQRTDNTITLSSPHTHSKSR
jgi:hypothetical protein